MTAKDYMGRLHLEPCIVCLNEGLGETPPEAHHILKNFRRMGDEYTIPICNHHHKGGIKGLAFHSTNTEAWEIMYGTQLDLLKQTRQRMIDNGAKDLPELKIVST